MKKSSRCLALAVAILSFGSLAQAQRKTDATRILNNMFRTYDRLGSYQDEGILISTNDEETGGTIEKMPFKTFFKRPNLFRFEWTDFRVTKLGSMNLTWSNGKEAFTYWEPDRYEKEESLDLALAGASGASSGTAGTVSELLLSDEVPSTLKRLDKVSLLGEEVFEGVRCYRIKAMEAGDPVELWVGKNDFLLRKLKRETKFDDRLWIREEIRRKIQVDQSIPEVVFNYKPPIPLTPRKDIDTEAMNKLLNPGPPVWSEFRSDEGRFSVLMPEKPVSQASTVETAQGRFEQHAFIASHTPLICLVSYTDIPTSLVANKNVELFFDGVQEQFIKETEGKVGSKSSISLDGYPGREVKVHLFRGELRLRLFLVGDRLYFLSVAALDKAFESDAEIPINSLAPSS